jgi:hypothetical protein
MEARLTPFAATSNGFIFPHVRCTSAIHDLQLPLHLISEKIWLLHHSFVSLALEQRNIQ